MLRNNVKMEKEKVSIDENEESESNQESEEAPKSSPKP